MSRPQDATANQSFGRAPGHITVLCCVKHCITTVAMTTVIAMTTKKNMGVYLQK